MIDPPQPNQAGQVVFGKCGKGNKIENYAVVQTIDNLNALILDKYNKEKEKPRLQENPWLNPRQRPELRAITFPNLKQDVEAEIQLKKALEDMMDGLRIPCLIIRSVTLKAINTLRNLGLNIPAGDGEINLIMAYVFGDFLHIVIFETYPWQTECVPLNKQAVDKAEKQLSKDLDILMAILTDIPRVAKCHRYGRLICVNFLEVWGKILECNIRASGVG